MMMPSGPSKKEEKYSLLKDETEGETEGETCEEEPSRATSVDQEAGTVRVKRQVRLPWQTLDPAWKSWTLYVPLGLIFAMLFGLAFFPSCEKCHQIDTTGYVCAPNGAIPKIARDRGCEFDTMSFKWWPKEPFLDADNQALLKDFHNDGPWHRYYDKGGKHEIPGTSEVLTAGWVTRKEHTFHCMYTLRQTHLWMMKGYDAPWNYTHTIHCTKYLMDTILENPPKDFDDLTVHGTPWPEHPDVVKPYYPCKQEGLGCESW